jgi:hypothetical protein
MTTTQHLPTATIATGDGWQRARLYLRDISGRYEWQLRGGQRVIGPCATVGESLLRIITTAPQRWDLRIYDDVDAPDLDLRKVTAKILVERDS